MYACTNYQLNFNIFQFFTGRVTHQVYLKITMIMNTLMEMIMKILRAILVQQVYWLNPMRISLLHVALKVAKNNVKANVSFTKKSIVF